MKSTEAVALAWFCAMIQLSTAFHGMPPTLLPMHTSRTSTGRRKNAAYLETSVTRLGMFDFFKKSDKEGTPSAKGETKESPPEQSASSDDPVDKIFSFFFGEKEENPMGMKRFGRG